MLTLALLFAFTVTGCEEKLKPVAAALQQRNLDQARSVLKSLKTDCDGWVSYHELDGVAKALTGDFQEAELAFRHAEALQPNSSRILTELGVMLLKQHKTTESVARLEEALALEPSNGGAKRYLLSAYIEANHSRGILKLLDDMQAGEQSTLLRDPALLLGCVQALLETGQPARVSDLIEANKDLSSPVLFSLGTLLAAHKRYQDAIRTLERIPSADADEAAFFNLALSYSHLRQFEKARRNYFRAIDKQPDYLESYLHVGIDFASAGDLRKAIPWLFRARELAPARPDITYTLAELLIGLRYLETAEDIVKSALNGDPSQPLLIAAGGDVAEAKGNLPEARAAYANALEKQPSLVPALVGVARCDIAESKSDSARMHIQKALLANADDPTAAYQLGRIEMSEGRWAEAVRYLSRSWSVDQSNSAVGLALARALRHAGKPSEALPLLASLVAAMPDAPEIHVELAQLYAQLGKTSQAETERSTIARLNAASRDSLQFEAPQTYVH